MHVVDVGAVVVLLVTVIRGMRRGVLLSLLDVARILCAYWAAWRFARPAGRWLASHIELDALPATVFGGLAVFVAVTLCFGLIAGWFRRGSRGGPGLSFAGGVIGLTLGAVAVVVLCWVYGVARTAAWGARLPSAETSTAMRWSKKALSQGAYLALRTKGGDAKRTRRLAAMVSDPERSTGELRSVARSPSFARLVADSSFGRVVRTGDRSAIMGNLKLQALLADTPTMNHLARLGIVPENWNTPAFRDTLAGHLSTVGTRIDDVLADSAVQRSLSELQREGLWAPEKLPRLITDGRFLAIVDQVMAGTSRVDTLEMP